MGVIKAFIVYWHPEAKSFNAARFHAAAEVLTGAGHEVRTSDLNAMRFDPISSRSNFTSVKDPDYFKQQLEEMHAAETDGFAPIIEAEMEKVEWCDLMIWQFPLWWFGLPATLKGWFDRVFAMGRFYGGSRAGGRGKRALLSLTTGGPQEGYVTGGYNRAIAGILRQSHRGIIQFTCFERFGPQLVSGPARMKRARQ